MRKRHALFFMMLGGSIATTNILLYKKYKHEVDNIIEAKINLCKKVMNDVATIAGDLKRQ